MVEKLCTFARCSLEVFSELPTHHRKLFASDPTPYLSLLPRCDKLKQFLLPSFFLTENFYVARNAKQNEVANIQCE
jgi:hypothetical protein